jgi:hypothetical protein
MRTLSIITAITSLVALSSGANAGLNLANGLSTNGIRLGNAASVHLRQTVVNANDMQVYGLMLAQRSVEKYRR